MARAQIRCISIAVALLVWLSVLEAAASAETPAPVDSCSVVIAVPNNDGLYTELARLWDRKIHLTCPVNTRKQNQAKVFVLHATNICGGRTLFGYPVVSRQMLTEADANRLYGRCSGVAPFGKHETPITQKATYTWVSTLPKEADRDHEMESLFGQVAGGLVASGLPVDGFFSVNNTYCFEIDAEYPSDPLTAVRAIGINVPASIRQTRHPNSSCWKLLHVRDAAD